MKEKNVEYDDPEEFGKKVAAFGAKLDARLIEQFVEEFSSLLTIKNKKVAVVPLLEVCDYYLSRHPTEPLPVKKAKSDKKKKKKKDNKSKKAK